MSIKKIMCSQCGRRIETSFVSDGFGKVTTSHGICPNCLKLAEESKSNLTTKKRKQRTTLRELLTAIRRHCLECANGSRTLVRNCQSVDCNLYPHRMGYFSSSSVMPESQNSQVVSRVSAQDSTISESVRDS